MQSYQTRTTAKSTAANQLPVSLQQAKLHLRIVSDALDNDVQLKLEAAIDYCERVTGRSLRVSHTVVQSYSCWPCGIVRFDWQPAYSISSLTYYDANGTQQTVSASDYRLIQGNAASILEFDHDYSFPTLYDRTDAVQVTYLAGYATVADVPPAAVSAILLFLDTTWGDSANIIAGPAERTIGTLLASVSTGAYR